MVEYLKEYFKKNDVEYKEKEKLSKYSSIKIGGRASIIAFPDSENKFINIISFCEEIGVKYKIAGNMSNILPSDSGYNGIIIKTDKLNGILISENIATVGCGVKLPFLSSVLADASLSGFEGLSGIPGQIGGSVRGNAGAFGREISDIIVSVTAYLPKEQELIKLCNRELDFSYRKSRISNEEIIVISSNLKLSFSDTVSVKSEIVKCREIRNKTQPLNFPSLGSFFKRTDNGIPAARLIDECGLKGYKVGGAEISEKHAGFIINRGDACASDVVKLADITQQTVLNQFGLNLQREVEFLV